MCDLGGVIRLIGEMGDAVGIYVLTAGGEQP